MTPLPWKFQGQIQDSAWWKFHMSHEFPWTPLPWKFYFFFHWPLEFPHFLSSISLLEIPCPPVWFFSIWNRNSKFFRLHIILSMSSWILLLALAIWMLVFCLSLHKFSYHVYITYWDSMFLLLLLKQEELCWVEKWNEILWNEQLNHIPCSFTCKLPFWNSSCQRNRGNRMEFC